jgi:predicted secreted protein
MKGDNRKMKRFTGIVLATVLILSALAGCSETPQGSVYGKEDTNITVSKGDTFIIQLEENPTTGYEWRISVSDDSIVTLTRDEYAAQTKESNIEGAGGTHSYQFKSAGKGAAQITFVYERSFEENSAVEMIVYNVTVN